MTDKRERGNVFDARKRNFSTRIFFHKQTKKDFFISIES